MIEFKMKCVRAEQTEKAEGAQMQMLQATDSADQFKNYPSGVLNFTTTLPENFGIKPGTTYTITVTAD